MPGYSGDMFPYGRPDGFGQGFQKQTSAGPRFGTAVFVGFCARLSVNNSYKPFQSIKEGQSGVKVLTKSQKRCQEP